MISHLRNLTMVRDMQSKKRTTLIFYVVSLIFNSKENQLQFIHISSPPSLIFSKDFYRSESCLCTAVLHMVLMLRKTAIFLPFLPREDCLHLVLATCCIKRTKDVPRGGLRNKHEFEFAASPHWHSGPQQVWTLLLNVIPNADKLKQTTHFQMHFETS